MNDSKVVLCVHGKIKITVWYLVSRFGLKLQLLLLSALQRKKSKREILSFDMKLYEIIGNFSNVSVYVWMCVFLEKFNSQLKIRFISFGILLLYGSRLPKTVTTTTKKERSKASIFFFLISKINQMRCWENKFNRLSARVFLILSLLLIHFEVELLRTFHWRSIFLVKETNKNKYNINSIEARSNWKKKHKIIQNVHVMQQRKRKW